MKSDSTNTDFSKKCEILDELWMAYRDAGPMQDYMEYNDGDYRDWETDRKSTRLNSSHRL